MRTGIGFISVKDFLLCAQPCVRPSGEWGGANPGPAHEEAAGGRRASCVQRGGCSAVAVMNFAQRGDTEASQRR